MAIFLFSILAGIYLTLSVWKAMDERHQLEVIAGMMPKTFNLEVADARESPLLFWFGVLASCWLWFVLGGIAFYFIYDDFNYGYEKILLWPFIAALVRITQRLHAYSLYREIAKLH